METQPSIALHQALQLSTNNIERSRNRVLDEILEERVVPSREQKKPRGVKRKMSGGCMGRVHVTIVIGGGDFRGELIEVSDTLCHTRLSAGRGDAPEAARKGASGKGSRSRSTPKSKRSWGWGRSTGWISRPSNGPPASRLFAWRPGPWKPG